MAGVLDQCGMSPECCNLRAETPSFGLYNRTFLRPGGPSIHSLLILTLYNVYDLHNGDVHGH